MEIETQIETRTLEHDCFRVLVPEQRGGTTLPTGVAEQHLFECMEEPFAEEGGAELVHTRRCVCSHFHIQEYVEEYVHRVAVNIHVFECMEEPFAEEGGAELVGRACEPAQVIVGPGRALENDTCVPVLYVMYALATTMESQYGARMKRNTDA
jgi:hypothetical protein